MKKIMDFLKRHWKTGAKACAFIMGFYVVAFAAIYLAGPPLPVPPVPPVHPLMPLPAPPVPPAPDYSILFFLIVGLLFAIYMKLHNILNKLEE